MHPNIIIGGFSIHAWTLCMHVSWIIAVLCSVICRPSDSRLSRTGIFWAGLIFVLFGILGARLFGIFVLFIKDPHLSMHKLIHTAGMAYLGTPLLGFFSLWIFSAITNTSFLENADYFAPYIMLARAVGRLGCLLNGCCFGTLSRLPWAVPTVHAPGGLRHPTQAYALIAALSIAIAMFIQYPKLKKYKGAVFFIVVTLYAFMRFFNEILRTDSPVSFAGIKLSMLTMALLFIIGLTGVFFILRKANNRAEIFRDTAYYFIVSLLWVSFLVLGMLITIRIM